MKLHEMEHIPRHLATLSGDGWTIEKLSTASAGQLTPYAGIGKTTARCIIDEARQYVNEKALYDAYDLTPRKFHGRGEYKVKPAQALVGDIDRLVKPAKITLPHSLVLGVDVSSVAPVQQKSKQEAAKKNVPKLAKRKAVPPPPDVPEAPLLVERPQSARIRRAAQSVSRRVSSPTFGPHNSVDLVSHFLHNAPTETMDKVWKQHLAAGGKWDGAYSYFDAAVLIGMIRQLGARRVVECAPNFGWSTAFIQIGLAGQTGTLHASFDEKDNEEKIRQLMTAHLFPPKRWLYVQGDFKLLAWTFSDLIRIADLVFIDADHSAEFAKFYLEELRLFDLVKAGCLVHIHDIYPREDGKPPESQYVWSWLDGQSDRFDLLWTYEFSALPEVARAAPRPDVFLDHQGQTALNPTLWLRKRE